MIESFLLGFVRGNIILTRLNHFFYTFFNFSLTSIVTLQIFYLFIPYDIDFFTFLCYTFFDYFNTAKLFGGSYEAY